MTQSKKEKEQPLAFEVAFERLENILEKMNSGQTPLDESLSLFEEANGLITHCQSQLKSAEKRVEALIKKRSGEIELDDEGNPQVESFDPKDKS